MEPIIVKARSIHSATVFLLHGLGDTGQGWASAIPALNRQLPHVKFVLPTAPTRPVTLNMGIRMPAWFDIFGLGAADREDEAGLDAGRKTYEEMINKEIAAGIPSNRIVLAGFSQGGALSLYTGLQYDKPLAGIVAMSCWLPLAKAKFPAAISSANRGIKVLQCHGDQDPLVSLQWAQKTNEVLKAGGVDATLKVYEHMAHSACPQELSDVAAFLQRVLPEQQ